MTKEVNFQTSVHGLGELCEEVKRRVSPTAFYPGDSGLLGFHLLGQGFLSYTLLASGLDDGSNNGKFWLKAIIFSL